MKKLRYTEGPWRALSEEVDKQYIRIRGTLPGSRYRIANVLCPSDYRGEADETRANARLIAAAPELLDALENLVRAVKASEIDLKDTRMGRLIEEAQELIEETNG